MAVYGYSRLARDFSRKKIIKHVVPVGLDPRKTREELKEYFVREQEHYLRDCPHPKGDLEGKLQQLTSNLKNRDRRNNIKNFGLLVQIVEIIAKIFARDPFEILHYMGHHPDEDMQSIREKLFEGQLLVDNRRRAKEYLINYAV